MFIINLGSRFSNKKLKSFLSISCKKTCSLFRPIAFGLKYPFWTQLIYFVTISLLGFFALSVSEPRNASLNHPRKIDIFLMSVSATTVSSMSTMEMEVFSNAQLIIMTILMFVGGEVFVSMLEIQLSRFKFTKLHGDMVITTPPNSKARPDPTDQVIGLPIIYPPPQQTENKNLPENDVVFAANDTLLKYNSIKCLGYVVLCYLLAGHMLGYTMVCMYTSLVPTAKHVLKAKAIKIPTFSIFTVVSTFANCGFIPTNENMIVFKKNSGLLLILIAQILVGNTLYPTCLWLLIWSLWKVTKRTELNYMLRNYEQMGYSYLHSGLHSFLLGVTVFGFLLVQFILFCAMDWNLGGMNGLTTYQKLVASLFQIANSRHAGESVVDLSTISAAVLVLFVLMM